MLCESTRAAYHGSDARSGDGCRERLRVNVNFEELRSVAA